jgi:AraC-like DNA-binding protein
MQGMRYAEFPAPLALESWVRCVWTFEATFDAEHDERIVPDGCPEIIIHFGEAYSECDASGHWQQQAPALLAGNLTRPLLLRAKGRVGVLGIRLWPHVARHVVNLPASATLDTRTPLVLPDFAALRDRLVAGNDDERLAHVPGVLARLAPAPVDEESIGPTVMRIFASRGQIDPETLAEEAGVSLRQLERRMKSACGMSLKLLASLVRFRSVFDELQADVPSPWLNAALAAGYFDQAHMIRDFRRFAGQPPSAFLPRAGALSTAIVSTPA